MIGDSKYMKLITLSLLGFFFFIFRAESDRRIIDNLEYMKLIILSLLTGERERMTGNLISMKLSILFDGKRKEWFMWFKNEIILDCIHFAKKKKKKNRKLIILLWWYEINYNIIFCDEYDNMDDSFRING